MGNITTSFTASSDGSYNPDYPTGNKPASAPILSLPTFASVAATSVLLGCTTDEAGGTLYFYVSVNSSESAATIKASGSTDTSVTVGINTRTVTGLTASTAYYGHMIQVDSGTTDSNVVNTTQFTTAAAGTADYPLEIIQPRAGLTTTNRFYKQYTGIEYNVRLGVIGGNYDSFSYSLTASPSGMTIDSATGEITWPNPIEAGSPHTVTAQVADGAETKTVTWTITVETSGVKFIDSVSGSDANDGSLASPWATLDKILDAAASDFIYFRTGSYATTTHTNYDGALYPTVWMAYPSELPTFDFALGAYFFSNSSNKLFIDGLDVDSNANTQERAFSYASNQSNITFRRNTFSGVISTGSNNSSYIFATNTATQALYTVIQDNETIDGAGYFYLGYANSHVLVENNTMAHSASGISPKDGNSMYFIRGNTSDMAGDSVHIQEYDSQGHGRGPIIIEYNNFKESSDGEVLAINGWAQNEQVIISRNTLRGRLYCRPTSGANGPFIYRNNVIVTDFDDSYTDRIRTGPEGDQGVIVTVDNLVGYIATGIVDANGDLQGSYRTTYLGTRGYEVV